MPRTKQAARGKKRGRRAAKGSEEVDDKMEVETSDQVDNQTVKQLDESQTSEVADESQASEVADESQTFEIADESITSEQGNGSVCKDTEVQEVNENDNTRIDAGREESEENSVKDTQDNAFGITANGKEEVPIEGVDENLENSEEKKIEKPEEIIIPYKPHTFPDFSSLQLIGKFTSF